LSHGLRALIGHRERKGADNRGMTKSGVTELRAQLQRGLGRGYRAAIKQDPAALHPLLYGCITHDPRWDHQLDNRRWYYASLALRSDLPLRPLRVHLEENDDSDSSSWSVPLTLSVLGDLARAAVDEAVGILADYAGYGYWWRDAVGELMAADADVLPTLEGVITKRMAEAPPGGNEATGIWSQWGPRIPEVDRIAAAVLPIESEPRELDLRSMTSREILAEAEGAGPIRRFEEELSRRREEGDVNLLLATAAESGASLQARAVSLTSLALQGDPRIISMIEANLRAQSTPRALRRASIRALEMLPAELTLDRARRWVDADQRWQRRAAAGVLSAHATPDDIQRLMAGLARALSEDDQYWVSSFAEALERLPEGGPYSELVLCFEEMTYSFGRHYVAAALAATDPSFSFTVALECLWDCEPSIRELACRSAHPTDDVRARLEEIADDPLEDEAVVGAAVEALGRGG
jgi:hypothetical protein